jgi:Uncharacterized protein conserved in bacteria
MKLNEFGSLSLAFVGDSVFDLFVREYLIEKGNCPAKKLHAQAVKIVNCAAQARFLNEVLMPALTEEEADVCRRGKNAHVNHVPKNANISDYHGATALESLFGYLYLQGNIDRVRHLFQMIVESIEDAAK